MVWASWLHAGRSLIFLNASKRNTTGMPCRTHSDVCTQISRSIQLRHQILDAWNRSPTHTTHITQRTNHTQNNNLGVYATCPQGFLSATRFWDGAGGLVGMPPIKSTSWLPSKACCYSSGSMRMDAPAKWSLWFYILFFPLYRESAITQ